ncbi:MAG: DUF3987 domain-containing protein [Phycisphaerales bacterium]|nr:DUF3987 domain-containing protein [Phycisphaerales bacterium]
MPAPDRHHCLDHISRFLRAMFGAGDVFEVRAPKCQERAGSDFRSTTAGYFTYDSIDAAAQAIVALDASGLAPGIYVTLNPVASALLARSANRLQAKAKTLTADADIVVRRHLLIDCDPVRPADISSTDAELALAAAKAEAVQGYLADLGWPAPIRVMSGNGHHLLYQIDLPRDDDGLVQRVLGGLAEKFDDEKVKIDRSVHNPARITKIPGTMVRKGDDLRGVPGIEDRPHRRSELLSLPDEMITVTPGLLEPLGGPPTPPPRITPARDNGITKGTRKFARFDHTLAGVRGYLESHGVQIVKERIKGDSTMLDLAFCPVTGVEANGTEISVMVTSGGAIAFKNLHNRGEGFQWVDVREALEPGYKQFIQSSGPRTLSQSAGHSAIYEAAPEWEHPLPLYNDPQAPAFPIESAFPPALAELRDFAIGLARELQVPVDLVVLLMMSIAGAAISKKFEIEARQGWREILVIWVLILLTSGERKSGTFRRLTDPIIEWERDEAARLGPDLAAAREEREIVEAERQAARKRAGKGDPEARKLAKELAQQLAAMNEITPPTLITTDATSEALLSLLVANGERALVASPEADALDVLMGRYDDKARPNMGIWLKGYSGDRVRVHRKGRDPEFLEKPALSVALTTQPDAVRGMYASRAAHGRGLLARFFPALPDSKVGEREVAMPPVAEPLEMAYVTTIRKLLEIPLDLSLGPRIVRLSPDAADLFMEFERKIEAELGRRGSLCESKEWGAKLCGGILRIAGILHCIEVHGRGSARSAGSALEVNLVTMKAALAWAPYLIEHEALTAGIVGCDPDTATAGRILRWLERIPTTDMGFSRRDCFTAVRGRHIQAVRDIDGALRLLAELGYIRPLAPSKPGEQGGRPASHRWAINPLWDRGGGK